MPEISRKLAIFCAKTFFLRVVSLVLGLEHSCSWPREGLSSESRSLALASDFFVTLAFVSSLVSSTSLLLNSFLLSFEIT